MQSITWPNDSSGQLFMSRRIKQVFGHVVETIALVDPNEASEWDALLRRRHRRNSKPHASET
jgi:hypothetical protein